MSPRLAVLAILGAMVIFGANFAVTRLGTQYGLTPGDLAAARFGVAGLLLLPVFVRHDAVTCAGLGWRRGILLAVTGGVVMTLCMNTGLKLAPAVHGAALGPGTVTTVGVLYGVFAARGMPPFLTVLGLVTILAGLATIAIAGSSAGGSNVLLGDLLFFTTGLLWGFYPILLHRWRIGPIVSAAVVAVLSLVYLPVWLAGSVSHLAAVPLWMIILQCFYQGVLNSIVGLWLWGHAVRTLGASRTQLFPPLIPVLGALFAIPVLGEVPGPAQWLGLVLIVGGIVASLFGMRLRRPAEH
ncbi:EamA family transporter [Enterovirga aerilata]|uniref:DMT family transporter n=1 Tax=Enterovirga aerilata TaxID=2730920 RepID=A0A849HWP4_9HYPH|nr:DMT family transporter [Enterovirga sp. DB1703]